MAKTTKIIMRITTKMTMRMTTRITTKMTMRMTTKITMRMTKTMVTIMMRITMTKILTTMKTAKITMTMKTMTKMRMKLKIMMKTMRKIQNLMSFLALSITFRQSAARVCSHMNIIISVRLKLMRMMILNRFLKLHHIMKHSAITAARTAITHFLLPYRRFMTMPIVLLSR